MNRTHQVDIKEVDTKEKPYSFFQTQFSLLEAIAAHYSTPENPRVSLIESKNILNLSTNELIKVLSNSPNAIARDFAESFSAFDDEQQNAIFASLKQQLPLIGEKGITLVFGLSSLAELERVYGGGKIELTLPSNSSKISLSNSK